MGLIECASRASIWRGYDYFKNRKVINLEKTGENIYAATVAGSSNRTYSIALNIDHPRKSKCNCPHAAGKRIICKHIVAAYFTILPNEAEKFYADIMAHQEEEETQQEELSDKVIEYVGQMEKADLCQSLLELLFDGPEWQYDRFVREHGLNDDWY